jgi:hypothetical protein
MSNAVRYFAPGRNRQYTTKQCCAPHVDKKSIDSDGYPNQSRALRQANVLANSGYHGGRTVFGNHLGSPPPGLLPAIDAARSAVSQVKAGTSVYVTGFGNGIGNGIGNLTQGDILAAGTCPILGPSAYTRPPRNRLLSG